MNGPSAHLTLKIRKYPNRRFYDTTRSRHATLQELHEAILSGHSIEVLDSRTGEDITNVILVQILLEKDPPKLHFFPSWILHAMVRSKPSTLRTALDRFFSPLTGTMTQTQRSLDEVMNRALAGEIVTPLDWTQAMMRAFATPPASPNSADPEPPPPPEDVSSNNDGLNELREQVNALGRKLAELEHRTRSRRKSSG